MIKPTTKVKEAAEIWLAEVEAAGHHSTNTRKVYASSLTKHVIGGSLAHLTLREVKVVSIGRWLRGIGETSGPDAMKTARSVLSGVLHLAVRHEAIPHNPVRDVGPVRVPAKQTKRDLQRALTREEREALLTFADADPTAHRRDLGDLLAFMAGTGARVGEACGVRWSDLDLDVGTVKLGSLPVRVPGQGLVLPAEGQDQGEHPDAGTAPVVELAPSGPQGRRHPERVGRGALLADGHVARHVQHHQARTGTVGRRRVRVGHGAHVSQDSSNVAGRGRRYRTTGGQPARSR